MKKIILACSILLIFVAGLEAQYYLYLPVILKDFTPNPTLKGFLLPAAYYEHCATDMEVLNADWYYTNGVFDATSCAPDIRYVPLIFGKTQATDANIALAVQSALSESGWLAGFNEPNLLWGANTTPLEGAELWRKIEAEALPVGIKLIAPTPSQHYPCQFGCEDNLYGHTWIWEMVDEYEILYGEKPHFDAFGWNVFMSDPDDIKDYLLTRRLEAMNRGYDLPFWVMSYAGECWNTDTIYPTGNEAVMTEMTDWFIETPWVTRIAWFTHRIRADDSWALNHHSCTLVNPETGELTNLGIMYSLY